MDKITAATRYMFFQNGNVNKDSFSDKLLIALNISITTKIERDTVVALWLITLENISQPI